MEDRDDCATLVSSRLVHSGKDEAFGGWATRFEAAAGAAPGYRGLVRLEQPDGLVHFVQRFATEEDMRRWRDSAELRQLNEEADCASAAREQSRGGDCPVFRLPSEQAAPKWKTWIATWITVFPLLLVLNGIFAPLKLPQPAQLAITSPIMTAVLTWFILPAVRRRLRPWLLADAKGIRKEPG